MNPTVTLRFRRTTALIAILWALAALGVTLSTPLLDPERHGPPLFFSGFATDPWRIGSVSRQGEAAGVRPGDRIVAIDGQPVDRAVLGWRSRFQPDRLNLYRVQRPDGEEFDLALRPVPAEERIPPLFSFVSLALGLIGVVYLAVGLGVWRMRPAREASWALLLFCCAMATDLFLVPERGGLSWTLTWLNLPLLGATTFHLFTSYPIEPAWVVRHRGTHAFVYLLALGLGVLALAESWVAAQVGLLKSITFYFTVGIALLSYATLGRERMRAGRSPTAKRADVMLLGALVSFLPVLAVVVAQNILHTSLPWYLALLCVFLFPLTVAYGIVHKQLFEVRALAKSSAAYGAATLAITGVYAFLITFAAAEASRFPLSTRSTWFSVLFLFCAILAFNPLRGWMQRLVDRLFARERVLYGRAVREISDVMVSMLSIKEIVDRILVALTDTMGVERALVLLRDEESGALIPAASRGQWDQEALGIEVPVNHPLGERLRTRREELIRSDFDEEVDAEIREICRDVFDTLETELVVPILFGGDLLGAIAVGSRLSGERLTADDRELVRTLANQGSVAIENAKAFDEIAQLNETLETRVEERSRELQEVQAQLIQSEKMKSLGQLVAGIAHELNNPIGFVHANLKLVDEFIHKLLAQQAAGQDTARTRDAIERLLSRSREGTERIKKIVEDLRIFSRMDRTQLEEADLNREIDRTLSLMEPRLKEGIRVERDYEELPVVRCHIGQINQVFMNLLMNSVDALERSGTIRVRTRRTEEGVRVEFEDDGPGIAPDVLDRIFEPFFTTKPVGIGTGLGLSLSHGIVERHGGRIRAESERGQGACFVIEFPLDATPEAS
jgi:signal transduction histidine kinase